MQFVERRKSSRLQKKETQQAYKEESDTEIGEQEYDNKPRKRRCLGRKLAEHEKEEKNLSDEESWNPEAIHNIVRNRRGRKKKLTDDEIKEYKPVFCKGDPNEESWKPKCICNYTPRNSRSSKNKLVKHEKEEISSEKELHKETLWTAGSSVTLRNRRGPRSKSIEHERPKEISLERCKENCEEKRSIRRGRKRKLDNNECDGLKREKGLPSSCSKENKLENVVCNVKSDLEKLEGAPKFKRSRGRPRKEQSTKLSNECLQQNDKVTTFTCRLETDFKTPVTFLNEKNTKGKLLEQKMHVSETEHHTKLPEINRVSSDNQPKRSTSGKDLSLLRKHMENLHPTEQYNGRPIYATTKTMQGIDFYENPGKTSINKFVGRGNEDPSRHATPEETNNISNSRTSISLHPFICETANNEINNSKTHSYQDFTETFQNFSDHSYHKTSHGFSERYAADGEFNEQTAYILLKPEEDSVDVGTVVKLEKVEDPIIICGNLVSGNVYKCMPVDKNNLCDRDHKLFSEKEIIIMKEDNTPSSTKDAIRVPSAFFSEPATLEKTHVLSSCVSSSNCAIIYDSAITMNKHQTNANSKNVDCSVQTEPTEEVMIASKKELTEPDTFSSPQQFRGAENNPAHGSNSVHSRAINRRYSVRFGLSNKTSSVNNKQCSQLEISRKKSKIDHASNSLPAECTSNVAPGYNLAFAKQFPRTRTFADSSSEKLSVSNHPNVQMEDQRHSRSEDLDLGLASDDENERFLNIYRKQLDSELYHEKSVMSPLVREDLMHSFLQDKHNLSSILNMLESPDLSVMECAYEFLTRDIDSCISYLRKNVTSSD